MPIFTSSFSRISSRTAVRHQGRGYMALCLGGTPNTCTEETVMREPYLTPTTTVSRTQSRVVATARTRCLLLLLTGSKRVKVPHRAVAYREEQSVASHDRGLDTPPPPAFLGSA